ncbi:MAG: hypothetical protein AB1716_21535, partial [Planctomycetota bacterium]
DAVTLIDYIATVQWTDGYDVRTEMITALAPHAQERPAFAVFAPRAPRTEFARYLPQETSSFSVSDGLNVQATYKFVLDTLQAVGGAGLLAKWADFQKQIGIDVERDIVAWLEGGLTTVTLAEQRGSVWLLKVTDEQRAREKVSAALEQLAGKVSELAARNPGIAVLAGFVPTTAPCAEDRLPGFEELQFPLSPQPLVWGVADGHLIFGTSADAVALCLATARGTHPSVRENPRVMQAAIVPAGPFVSMSLTDHRNWSTEIAQVLGVCGMGLRMAGAAVPNEEARAVVGRIGSIVAKLGPVVRRINFYDSTATLTTFDGQHWRTQSVTHYVPPAERPTPEPGAAAAVRRSAAH